MSPSADFASVSRSWLERVLEVVGELGAITDLNQTLDRIVQAIVEVVEFDAAAINVVTATGDVRVEAVEGPPGALELLGNSCPLRYWLDVLDETEHWGALRFHSHERDQTVIDRIANWTPEVSGGSVAPGGWHADDALLVPLADADGELIGVLSVDQPRSGRLPDLEQRTILELFANQAAKAISQASIRQLAEVRRREAELRWQLAFEKSPVPSMLIEPDGSLSQINEAFAVMLGYAQADLASRKICDLVHPDDQAAGHPLFRELVAGVRENYEIQERFVRSDGEIVWCNLHAGAIRDEHGVTSVVVGQVNDITARKLAQEQLAHRATHDALTNLPNRLMIEEKLAQCLADGRAAGVLFCDLDRFKTVNDSLGHDAGDELLLAVARRLREIVPAAYMLGRLGGDEFVAVAPDLSCTEQLRDLGRLMMDGLRRPLSIRGREHTVGVSIGVTVSGPWHDRPDEVLRQADQALLRAKRLGRARVETYDPTQDKLATVADLEMEQELRRALEAPAGEPGLIPYFQPIISLDDHRAVGYEALVRWLHPTKGLLEPGQFLPLAEQTGLIVPLGWWMLEASCREAARPQLTGSDARWVAVNASGSQLGRGQLVAAISSALEAGNLPPHQLHLEITETALVDASPAAIREVCEVAELGVLIALDDFGTGYSSLSLLRDLPVGVVKIDRSFVAPIGVDRRAAAIVRNVISLCRELGVTTVAEGVETQEQLTALHAMGCNQAQGYLIGIPAPLDRQPMPALTATQIRSARP